MVHDELNDTCRDVMTHLVRLQKNRVGCCEKEAILYLKIDLVNMNVFFTVALMLQHAAEWILFSVHRGKTDNPFSLRPVEEVFFFPFLNTMCPCLKLQRILHQLQTVPCCWQRICRWHWKKSLQPAARTSSCLSPKSYRPTLIWAGWLEERRE